MHDCNDLGRGDPTAKLDLVNARKLYGKFQCWHLDVAVVSGTGFSGTPHWDKGPELA